MALQSITNTTGAAKRLAISAVELTPSRPPSYNPMTPSIIDISTESVTDSKKGIILSGGTNQVSKL